MKQGSVVQGEKLAWSSDQISAAVIYGNNAVRCSDRVDFSPRSSDTT